MLNNDSSVSGQYAELRLYATLPSALSHFVGLIDLVPVRVNGKRHYGSV